MHSSATGKSQIVKTSLTNETHFCIPTLPEIQVRKKMVSFQHSSDKLVIIDLTTFDDRLYGILDMSNDECLHTSVGHNGTVCVRLRVHVTGMEEFGNSFGLLLSSSR